MAKKPWKSNLQPPNFMKEIHDGFPLDWFGIFANMNGWFVWDQISR